MAILRENAVLKRSRMALMLSLQTDTAQSREADILRSVVILHADSMTTNFDHQFCFVTHYTCCC
jgi:hypothetical protein